MSHREIIDESDVYVDVHKAIRRTHPAPKARVQRKDVMVKDAAVKDGKLIDLDGDNEEDQPLQKSRTASISGRHDSPLVLSSSPRATLLMRRSSTGQDGRLVCTTIPVKANYEQMRGHLKHLGPSNPASNPKTTKYSNVKIKPGGGSQTRSGSVATESQEPQTDTNGVNERTSLLRPPSNGNGNHQTPDSYAAAARMPAPKNAETPTLVITPEADLRETDTKLKTVGSNASLAGSSKSIVSTLNSNAITATERQRVKRGNVRSGSITETEVNTGGVRKFVLEATSSGDEEGSESSKGSPTSSSARLDDVKEEDKSADDTGLPEDTEEAEQTNGGSSQGNLKKKNRRKKRKGGK